MRRFTPQEDQLLGKDSDSEIAKQLNREKSAVRKRRKLLGIPQCAEQDRTHRPHTLKVITISLIEAAVDDGCTSCRAVAEWIGCSTSAVWTEINNAKREGFVVQDDIVAWFGAKSNRLLKEDRIRLRSLLGTASDADLAQEFGISSACVCQHRLAKGVPRYEPRRVG